MNIVMVGTGYVGLVSGVCFADLGHNVVCVDKDTKKIETLQSGSIPIYEPGLQSIVNENVKAGRLSFTTDLASVAADADAIFIAVGTPSRRGDGFADLTYVYSAAEEIASHVDGYTVIVTKSTVPVGTGDKIESILLKTLDSSQFSVVSNPEFLREGVAIEDFKRPDRIVVGLEDDDAKKIMSDIYRPLIVAGAPILFTTRRTSELIKYAANAFLATKITFINEMADLCEAVNANVTEVAKGIGLDKRIGAKFLNAGPGYGGSCFPKDTIALVRTGDEADVNLSIVKSVADANKRRKIRMARKIIDHVGGVDGKTIAILGLAFKPDTDDMREAPSTTIVSLLQKNGATIKAYDPEAMEESKHEMTNVEYSQDAYECVKGANAVVLVTEWDEFQTLNMNKVKSLMNTPNFIDLRNVYSHSEMSKLGFNYTGVGV